MELYQLKTFVTVAELSHLTRAAERLHTSQPAVSAHIKALEEELGVMLFIRTPRGMTLTREGGLLREKAQATLDTIDALHHEASVLQDKVIGTARLGIHIDPQYLKIDRFLSHMRRQHPELDFHLLQRWSYQQAEEFRSGQLDAGFIYGEPELPGMVAVTLRKINVVVVGPAAWEEKLRHATWEEVAEMPWVWTPKRCTFCKIAEEAFDSRGLNPLKVTVADQEPVINTLVSSGIGLSLMIEEEALDAKKEGRVSIWGEHLDTVDLSFIYPEKPVSNAIIKAVVDGVCHVWGIC